MSRLKSFFGNHIAWGWPSIAAELGVSVRTAKRWRGKGLPVRAGPGQQVWAFKIEIRLWLLEVSGLKAGRPRADVKRECKALFNQYVKGKEYEKVG